MNGTEIATRVKRQFGDESGVQVTDADVIRWIGDAQREIAGANDLLQTVAHTAVVPGQQAYDLPPDILLLRSVRYQGRKLQALSNREAEEYIQREDNDGQPSHYWVWAGVINLYPQPTTSDPDDLQIFYTRQPANLTALTQTPELPLEYHNRIVEYCLAQAYELDENWEAAQQKASQFNNGLASLKGKEEWTTRDYYPSITSVPEDWWNTDAEMYW